jgi:signal transduction histidine kinase/ligand-binding sensor domain-containing protein/DNA-binding response OmpR family regulator
MLSPWLLKAQEFIGYDIKDGLSTIEVNDIREDENFLWIATSDGLNRFDGENFKIFKHENNNSNSLSENNIETLYFDSKGLLWIGFKTGGIDIYNPRTDKFKHLSQIINVRPPSRVISIMEDSKHNIWLGTWEEGVFRLVPDKNVMGIYKCEVHYPGFIVSSIIEKPEGYVRIGTYTGFFVYSLEENKWTGSGLFNNAISQLIDAGKANSLWCSTWSSGLLEIKWDEKNPSSVRIARSFTGEDFRSIHRIIKADIDKIYLGTWGEGIKVFDPDSGELNSLSNETFKAPLINCFFTDKFNNIWIGTYGNGLWKFNPEKNFVRFFSGYNTLMAPAIAVTDFDENKILVGTQGKGIFLCNLKGDKMLPKFYHSGKTELYNYILSFYSGRNILFAGHDGMGFPYYNHNARPDDRFKFKEQIGITELEKATAFYLDPHNKIWIGTKQNGLFSAEYNPRTGKITDFRHYDNFGREEITGFAEYDAGKILISSHNGLFIFNTVSNQIEDKGKLLINEIVYHIIRDEKNKCLWTGTSGKLLRINLDDPSDIKHTMLSDILPPGSIRVMILDRNNNLWFAIRNRIFCLTDKGKSVLEINPGLLDKNAILSVTNTFSGNNESLVFGTTGNLIIINPDKILEQSGMHGILFTELEIDHNKIGVGEKLYGKVILNEATEYIHSIKISHKCRWISLSFVEKEWDIWKNKFQFRIRGLSDNWQYLDLSSPVTVSQLNPGKYYFEIRKFDTGENSSVCWSLDMIVLPPWWKSGLFFFLLGITISAIAAVSVLMIIKYYRKRNITRLREIEKRKNEELLKEKESFFTGLSHDLMTPFSLILSPVNDLLRESSDDDPRKEKLEIISRNTSFLSDIFDTILDLKRAELADNKLKETNIEIVSFCRIVLNAFEYLAKSRNIELVFSSDVSSLNIVTDNVKVERILYNLLSNAIKFTPDNGRVSLSLKLKPGLAENLIFIVTDTGSGIDIRNNSVFDKFYRGPDKPGVPDNKGLGLGLYIVKKFITLLKGEISVSSSQGNGTEITVTLPITIKHENEFSEITVLGTSMNEDIPAILVVEDNIEMSDYLSKKLSSGFNVITASDGEEAMKMIERYLPEIIITDLVMPGMDGLSLCSNIKKNERYSDLLVVVLSAKSSTEDELESYKHGADIFLRKPVDTEILLNQMVNLQATWQKRKTQLMASLLSKENTEIEFDSKETFIKKSMQVIEENIMDADFKIDDFASEMNMSNTVLHRKFKLFIGQTPNQFIRLVRLRKSVFLLKNSDHTIAEIANLTGFNQSHYFIKCFREIYNETPKNFRESSKR